MLTKMKETAEAFLGQPVSKAVITVPGGCGGRGAGQGWEVGASALRISWWGKGRGRGRRSGGIATP